MNIQNIILKFINEQKFPLVIEPHHNNLKKEEFLETLTSENKFFKDNLLKFGGILFRNFPLANADDFSEVIGRMQTGNCMNYIGGDSPRVKVKGNIYTSTEAPPSFKIPLHNELSFVKNFPSHIYFFCERPSESGGETIIADCRKIYKLIQDDVRKKFINNGLKYVSSYYKKNKVLDFINKFKKAHKTWLDVFETEDKSEVERLCRENEFGYKWNKNEWIEITQQRPSVLQHPITHEEVWFNQAHLYDYNPRLLGWKNYIGIQFVYFKKHTKYHEIFFGSGEKIHRKDLYHVLDVLDTNTVAFPWQKGDVLVLDNILSMHGRAPFTGKRRILTAMTRA